MTRRDETAGKHFISPLRIGRKTAFTDIRFGEVTLAPDIAALRRELDERLAAILARLPQPLWGEALATIDSYGGSAGNFYSLFYVPVWSFLHWVPAAAAAAPLDPGLLQDAKTAQAMSLFVHLWDDHLCDGQLAADLLRLQVRTEAWQAYSAAVRRISHKVAPVSGIVEEHIDAYLTATHAETVDDLDAFCARFVRQVAIWTLTPRLLGLAVGGETAAAQLRQVIESFSLAWRILDDVQDIDLDMLEGVRSAVWYCLDEPGRRAWDACRAASLGCNELDQRAWDELSRHALLAPCVPRLLGLVDQHLAEAARAAASRGWAGMARELDACRIPSAVTAPARPWSQSRLPPARRTRS